MSNTQSTYFKKTFAAPGFTLIELVIVFVIISIISGLSLVSVRGFAARQEVTNTAKDFYSDVQLARSHAQTQVKPAVPECDENNPLNGYRVTLNCSAISCQSYMIAAVCGANVVPDSPLKQFPSGVTVQTDVRELTFTTLTGLVTGITNPGVIRFGNGNGTQMTVTVNSDGRVESNVE